VSYCWVEHTAEVELHISAGGEAAVFEDALDALRELIGGEEAHGVDGEAASATRGSLSRKVEVAASDRAALLAAWLDELVFLAETEDLVADSLEHIELGDAKLVATVRAHRGRPRHLVKRVTYHDLRFDRLAGEVCEARVVLDV
jgi:SHS2 domain-containing protein